MRAKSHILWFHELGLADLPLVGGKNASLGEMIRELRPKGILVPEGFAITASAYRDFLKTAKLDTAIRQKLQDFDSKNLELLAKRGEEIRQMILEATLPLELEEEIIGAYLVMCNEAGRELDTAVRSSATAEDLPTASFAGAQESFLNVKGETELLEACRKCYASLFTDRAISYRADMNFDHMSVALSIGVQRMVRSDKACAGVMFTIDTESGFSDAILISGAYGLGESVVKGRVDPDEFIVHKPMLKAGYRPILKRNVGAKQESLIYSSDRSNSTRAVDVSQELRHKLCLSDDEVLQLARWGCDIEEHYSRRAGKASPMDIEWAKDGDTGELFIVQARPETIHAKGTHAQIEIYRLTKAGTPFLNGRAVGEKIGAGKTRVITDAKSLQGFQPGEILVADMTDPDWEPTMKMASAIVTNRGGRTCHAAIVSRELGVPCVVGTQNGTERIPTGKLVTVSCAEGEVGSVYEGILPFEKEIVSVANISRPKTKIMVNVGNPEQAFGIAQLPNDGVGLAREEFIITGSIQIHPMALLKFESLKDDATKEKIAELTARFPKKSDYFVDKLAEGVSQIAAAFYPKDVILRMSDFKTNEYAGLLGGEPFEPKEENPMIGFRGASRYYHKRYREGFLLECQAMKKVREEMGLTNLKLMIPFCRTTSEAKKVLDVMSEAGLHRGQNGLEIYVMCEIPSNVILTEEFAKLFDGFSIGSNDLTQLVLGLDRDSEIVAPLFDERNPAVMQMIESVITRAKKAGSKIGICGQAPSDYPEFAEFLVKCGIDSISLNPDTLLRTTKRVLDTERRLGLNN